MKKKHEPGVTTHRRIGTTTFLQKMQNVSAPFAFIRPGPQSGTSVSKNGVGKRKSENMLVDGGGMAMAADREAGGMLGYEM
jgi:hypothetical protein